jgi:hypothetical protein
MSDTPIIKIRIDNDNKVHFNVEGVEGATCENLTDAMIKGLGEAEETCHTEAYDIEEKPDYVEEFEG